MSTFIDQELHSTRKKLYNVPRSPFVLRVKLSSTDRVILHLGKVVELSTYDKRTVTEW
ncbi:hypothetical protein HJTV-2_gp98 [Haloarcula virus HJTV-2]|uniref:Uncharacterized protein n=2 Tax=Haloferacalesvirus TaxID=2843389 RepID=A0AAE8Y006_9CAUD|nr:hypothetical protein M1M33_gp049 [Haloarcula virus HJTV-2]YP_010358526.1 hypothetical protein M1M41_gp043 [Halorubrum sodomense tailed virus 4]UBF21578.1 hypothetical protein HRTV-24_gp92 [Halorubrum virus HRTV-24]UBF21977.1 hypothetical protein HJTV-3_gp88 [Haloarcula virus HJTV-3]UBF22106.1 hypothetical protein HRTV-15_gp87 [Halorubrum virus HRTV-15]UBF20288.1 hypothetical protein HSTV-4_gp81 [Halorubrum sodomense tailed virus 4]UBF21718.1 hypothetical protein HJTV-2_gp98 [Haloarcula vir